ncbi:MAG: YaiI/YqxD family protein [Alteromonadaceae bacterium]|nr:YaiI/YqxD family protein [Alteromonadaceae bacterium]
MKIWVDADACPVVIKEIIFRAANRTKTDVTLVANQYIKTPASKYVTSIQVPKGFDVADDEIVLRCAKDDLVITSDIPLADEVITKGARALSPRGELFTRENIKSRLNIRDFMDTLRGSGVQTGGPPALGSSEKQAFGNELDKWLVFKQRSTGE